MNNFRIAQVRTLIPSLTAMALLLGTALLTRAVRLERPADPFTIADTFAREESPVAQCLRIAELLERGHLAEAEPLLVSLPITPISMDATPGTSAFQVQAQALMRLGEAMIQASLRQGKDGKKDEALERIRLCRAMLNYPGDSPQALEVSKKLSRMADTAESQLQHQLS